MITAFLILRIDLSFSQDGGTLLWKSSTDWHVQAVAPTGDIDGDGFADVFVGSADNLIYCYSGGGLNQGNIIWSWAYASSVWTTTSLSDINGDGTGDCLTGGADNTVYCMSGKPIGGMTVILWSYPVGGDVRSVTRVNDINGDGINDCYIGSDDDIVYCLEGAYGTMLWTYTDPSPGGVKTVSPIPDVNGDGIDDCLAGGENDKIMCISGGSQGTGSLIWSCTTGSTILSVTWVNDINGDGTADCFAGSQDDRVYCISGQGSGNVNPLWSYRTGSTVTSVAAITDVDGDGAADCLAGSQDDKIYCLSGANGSVIWTYTTGSTVRSVAAISDVNGTSGEDCIAGAEDNRIYCIEGKSSGNGTAIWTHSATGNVHCVAPITDISGNGTADVIAGSGDSYVYAIEGGAALSESVTTPNPPEGPGTGSVGQNLTFTGSGATSNLGHTLQYRFDWGDGTTSGWGASTQSHTYSTVGTYLVKAQARCQSHTGIVSGWSQGKTATVSGHTLTVSVNGSGTVVKNPNKSEYNHNENVTLTATPMSGYRFDHWEGALSGNTNPATLTMNGNKNVTAHFTLIPETISTPTLPTGSSTGKVGQNLNYTTGGSTSNLGHSVEYRFDWGDGTTSGWGASTQSHTYSTVGTYLVKAQARCQSHTDFTSGWSPGKTVTLSGHILSISINGSGSVTKNSNKSAYNHNETVTLTATPTSGSQFDHWEGALSGSTNPATLTMNGNKSVTAYFTQSAETITTPNMPTGSSTGKVGQNLNYTTGGSTSNLGHTVQYRFDWGDGTPSDWGASTQMHTYSTGGTYAVKAQARCQSHTGVLSGWSPDKTVTISGHTLYVSVNGSGTVTKFPNKNEYAHNENVILTATPTSGHRFDHWEGALTGNTNPVTVTMNGDKNIMAYFAQTTETISTPDMPTGPSSGKVGQALSFTTGGSRSNLGHGVNYRFDWGDGSTSGWGASTQTHTFSSVGTYTVRAQARCIIDNGVLS